MKKIVALLLSLVFAMSVLTVASAEDISTVNYYVEYNEDGTATVIFQASSLSAFDFGIIYEPDKLTVDSYEYSDVFKEMSIDSTYTAISVANDKAVDNVGASTYVVFTGAIMHTEDGTSVGFAEKDLAYVTFSGIDEGDEIAIVNGTAQVEDVKNAKVMGAVDLYKQMEIGDSYLLDGAVEEPDKNVNENSADSSNMTWLYGVVFGIIIVAAVVLVLVSKKNKLDVNVKEILEDEEDEDEEE